MATDFSSIPIVNFSLSSDQSTRPQFLSELQNALVNVGFFYLSSTPVSAADIDAVTSYAPRFFELPPEEKQRIRMIHSPHFFGYSAFGAELTKGKVDQREQIDFGTQYECKWKPGDPDYKRLWGPSQWPKEELIPDFRDTMESYIRQVRDLGQAMMDFIAEALNLPKSAFSPIFEGDTQHRVKIIKYPSPADEASNQGVGPHFDPGLLTILLQASPHRNSLQVQNVTGAWIDVPPIPGTFVVNIGKALEFVTQGVAIATSHRVLSPAKGSTPRYSVPFFQYIAEDLRLVDHVLDVPTEILKLKEDRGRTSTESVNFGEYAQVPAGEVSLIGRIKSHPDVAQRHYPDKFKQLFPDGLPVQGFAY